MQMAKPYILIADDDPEDRQIFEEEFVEQNPSTPVVHITGGKQLLSHLLRLESNDLPTIIVLDFQMPDINGPEVLMHLAANPRYNQIVIIMWSTSRRAKDIEESKRLGAIDYIIKPGTLEELAVAIRKLTAIFKTAIRPVL